MPWGEREGTHLTGGAGYAPEKIEYGINRYTNETRRLYSVLESHLEKSTSGFLVGDRLTIADISCVGWAKAHGRFLLSLSWRNGVH